MMKKVLNFILLLYFHSTLLAQYPAYFSNSVENGAPSNEVYWLQQDNEGYIWIGSDAGLYRYNGIRYDHFSSPKLTARSATGIIQSKQTGRIYAFNFNRQLFYVEQNELKVIESWNLAVNGLADDHNGNIWITSSEGTFKLNEKNFSITKINSKLHFKDDDGRSYSSHGISNPSGDIYYQCGNSLITWKKNTPSILQFDNPYLPVNLLFSRFSDHPWIFTYNGDRILHYSNGKYIRYNDVQLLEKLKGKKINCVFESKDGKIWIGTYSGLVCHDPKTKFTEMFYEQFSFSFGIEDSQGNFWFSTLHNGFIRIPNFNVRCWDTRDANGLPDQYNHLNLATDNIFLGGTYGFLGAMNTRSLSFQKIEHLPNADFGMIYWDKLDQCVYFNKNGQIFRYKDGRFTLVNSNGRPIKSMLHTTSGYFFMSSQGLYLTKSIKDSLSKDKMIDQEWYREICHSPFSSAYFAASNRGLVEIKSVNGKYKVIKKHVTGKQILSITDDKQNGKIYFIAFDGTLYSLDSIGKVRKILQIEIDIRATQLRYHNNVLYFATNKGILMINTKSYKRTIFNRFSGLNSNNIKALAFHGNYCWTAGEGIHRIPISEFKDDEFKSKIRLLRIALNDSTAPPSDLLQLDYGDKIAFFIDGMSLRSNDEFQFAYRIKGYNNSWITVPGSLRSIDFSSLPTGNIEIEVKLIDYQGKDSENVIRQKLYVRPPYWQRWWFYLLITMATLSLALWISRIRLNAIRKKQSIEMRRLKLENELRLTQQNALKAQMNPHFLFNVLNSIKGYIYENDKKNAARYLSDFSSLVRKVLELSSLPTVTLEKEIEALRLYIDLEAMLLQTDLEYSISIDENLEPSCIHVPALLLQPYVENAFKHGLRHKVGPKRLKIKMHMNDSDTLLIIEITDNGIGRTAAEILNNQNSSDHLSFATSAIEKRIQLLNFEKNDVVGVEIIDIFENNEPSGTMVIIRINAG